VAALAACFARTNSSRFSTPRKLVREKLRALLIELSTWLSAAKFTRTSHSGRKLQRANIAFLEAVVGIGRELLHGDAVGGVADLVDIADEAFLLQTPADEMLADEFRDRR